MSVDALLMLAILIVIPINPKPPKKGSSKLKKWTCGCTNIRVAVKDAEIQCLKCKNQFVEV